MAGDSVLNAGLKQPMLESPPLRPQGRQTSEPATRQGFMLPPRGKRQTSAPEPRKGLFRHTTEESAVHMVPVLFDIPLPNVPCTALIPKDFDFPDDISELSDVAEEGAKEGGPTLRGHLRDATPMLLVGCYMTMAQGASMCSFLGSIGYFSYKLGMPALLLYATIVQAVAFPAVLALQRRYDHTFDARFGHHATFLFRIGILSLAQVALLSLAPSVSTASGYLVLASLSSMAFVMAYAPVSMVVSCMEGAQAVNFVRTSSHLGGLAVVGLVHVFNIGSRSGKDAVTGFFVSVGVLQIGALLSWYFLHRTSKSLAAAYAVIAEQQDMSAASSKATAQENKGFTLVDMFGESCQLAGVILLTSFFCVQGAWSLTQSMLNMFGDVDRTQRLVNLTYVADIAGRVVSHSLHGLVPGLASRVPAVLLHAVTIVTCTTTSLLVLDTYVHFLSFAWQEVIVFGIYAATALNLSELAVKTMQLAKSPAFVAQSQNLTFALATGSLKIAALMLQWSESVR